MTIPNFTAQTSLSKRIENYVFTGGESYFVGLNTSVIPQGCGFFRWAACGAAVAACVPICSAVIPCYVGCLGISLYGFCRDCIRRAL